MNRDEPQPGDVIPLSACKPGWLIGELGGPVRTVTQDMLADPFDVTLLSAVPGWTPVGQGDPTKCRLAQVFWSDGIIGGKHAPVEFGARLFGAQAFHEKERILFWRDASHDAPAPVEPDLAARVAELETDLTKLEVTVIQLVRMHPKSWFKPGANPDPASNHKPAPSQLNEPVETNPTFRTSRKPDAPGVMGDEDAIERAWKVGRTTREVANMLFAHARQSVLAQLAANEERAIEAGLDVWSKLSIKLSPILALRAALSAIREGL